MSDSVSYPLTNWRVINDTVFATQSNGRLITWGLNAFNYYSVKEGREPIRTAEEFMSYLKKYHETKST